MSKYILIYLHTKENNNDSKIEFLDQDLCFNLIKKYLDEKTRLADKILDELKTSLLLSTRENDFSTYNIDLFEKNKERSIEEIDTISELSIELFGLLKKNPSSFIIITVNKSLSGKIKTLLETEFPNMFIMFNNIFDISPYFLTQIYKNIFF